MHGLTAATRRIALPLFALLVPALAMGQETANPILNQISGTTFRLASVTVGDQQLPLPARPAVTIRIDESGKVHGRSTVNLFFGSLHVTSEDTIEWGAAGLAVTRRAGPQTLMELESLFLQALERTTKISLDGANLTFSAADPFITLVFEPQAATHLVTDIFGKQLTLTHLTANGRIIPLPARPLLNLTIAKEGTCAGFSGVNRYFGKFQIGPGGAVNAGPVASTLMAGPKELMEIEEAFHQTLASVKKIEISASVVKLFDSTGALVLQFELR